MGDEESEQPSDLDINGVFDGLKACLSEIQKDFKHVNNEFENRCDKLKDYYLYLKKDVQLVTEIAIDTINRLNEKLIHKIQKHEDKTIKKIEASKKSEADLVDIESKIGELCGKWSKPGMVFKKEDLESDNKNAECLRHELKSFKLKSTCEVWKRTLKFTKTVRISEEFLGVLRKIDSTMHFENLVKTDLKIIFADLNKRSNRVEIQPIDDNYFFAAYKTVSKCLKFVVFDKELRIKNESVREFRNFSLGSLKKVEDSFAVSYFKDEDLSDADETDEDEAKADQERESQESMDHEERVEFVDEILDFDEYDEDEEEDDENDDDEEQINNKKNEKFKNFETAEKEDEEMYSFMKGTRYNFDFIMKIDKSLQVLLNQNIILSLVDFSFDKTELYCVRTSTHSMLYSYKLVSHLHGKELLGGLKFLGGQIREAEKPFFVPEAIVQFEHRNGKFYFLDEENLVIMDAQTGRILKKIEVMADFIRFDSKDQILILSNSAQSLLYLDEYGEVLKEIGLNKFPPHFTFLIDKEDNLVFFDRNELCIYY